ncbi:MAG: phosphoadenosine phosphosulfate reductase domain-containing protein [Promethearchaeota archaeon]
MSTNKANSRGFQKRKRGMKVPYLGRISLYWCDTCNVPLLDNNPCDICNNKGHKIPISPPGDIRPAFAGDFKILWESINKQYGKNIGELLFPTSKIILLNRIGGLDRTEEVIVDGFIIGILQFNIILNDFEFLPKMIGGIYIYKIQTMLNLPPKKHIYLKNDGIPYVLNGKSILAPGVKRFTNDIKKNDYCLIITKEIQTERSYCMAIGLARENSDKFQEMLDKNYGELAKNKFHLNSKEEFGKELSNLSPNLISNINLNENIKNTDEINDEQINTEIITTLKKAYQSNFKYLHRKIKKSMEFIKKTIKEINKPVAVAYSGGKDSLGVFLLVWKVLGRNFKIFFADTGLELPEVLDNIQTIAKSFKMESNLIVESANDTFWDLIKSFGPPGRDYRFCCHSLKAQNIMKIINTIYGGEKVLVFLGQRQYESLNRMKSKQIYVNSFIPLQIAATPIKSWNALTLWLFLLFENFIDPENKQPIKASITPLYFKAHERLGCYLCPASNLSNFKLLKTSHPKLYNRWFSFLNSYAEEHKLPREWVQYGLWRFKQYTPQWKNFVNSLNISLDYNSPDSSAPLNLNITKGFSQNAESEFSIKGKFSQPINLEDFFRFLPALTKDFKWDKENRIIDIKSKFKNIPYSLKMFLDGSFVLNSKEKDLDFYKLTKLLMGTISRSIYCNNCKTCVSVCTQNAVKSDNGKITIDSDKCINCYDCITHCPLFQIANKAITEVNFV